MRDYQRNRVYRAEQSMRRTYPGRIFHSLAEVQEYIIDLEDSAWFTSKYPDFKARVRVRVNTRRTNWALGGRGFIELPNPTGGAWAWTEIVVLHEMAHCLEPSPFWAPCDHPKARSTHTEEMKWGSCQGTHFVTCAAHGPEFAGNFLDMVRARIGGDTAAALEAAYRRYNVKVDHIAPEEVTTKPRHKVEVGEVIQRRVAKETGVTVAVMRTETGWDMQCEDHGTIEWMRGRLDAEAKAAHPREWCPQCAATDRAL